MSDFQPRQPEGIPSGGQFAAKANAADDIPPLLTHNDYATTIHSSRGIPWTVRVVPAGGSYGATGSLVAEKDMVEFYDQRGTNLDRPDGQFVSRYFAETLIEREYGSLALDSGTPEWSLDAGAMGAVRNFVRSKVGPTGPKDSGRWVEVDGVKVPAANPVNELDIDGENGWVCKGCGAPVTRGYDGSGSGWSHLYRGVEEGSPQCIPSAEH